ncbi:MAG: lipid II flippase MurJ [Humidesulfovibrio sp.]|uniref:lipid II flippase MurJ n=1 Tax=Humidesulfovibrio sp. TaxID=2910988 RepID=UPI00273465B7|nr:lipid II flippase MurJ [Humidesulfovibrio sp.]MDP2848387.1 lipid II flippase MurJ [Humidesulfovibrio sp.]
MNGEQLSMLMRKLREECSSRLARDSFLVLLFNGLARGIGMGKEMLIAALFGLGGQLDAYVLALLAPAFLANLLGANFSSALIPALGRVSARNTSGALAASNAAGSFLVRALTAQALLVALAALALALLPASAMVVLSPDATPERLVLTKALLTGLLPLFILSSLNHVLGSLVNYRGDFKGPALAATTGALTILLGIFLLHGGLGIHALVAGLNLGAAVEFGLLIRLMGRAWGGVFDGWLNALRDWRSKPSSEENPLPALLRGWGLLALGASLFGLTPFINNAIASTLGEGSVAALSYAAKLPAGFSALLGLTLSTVLLPHFTDMAHNAPREALLASCQGMVKRLALVSAPLALAGILASPLLVELLFQRGRFDAQAAQTVSAGQVWFFAQLPFFLLSIGAARMLQALSQFRFLLLLQAVLLAASGLMSFGLSRVMGVTGIAASSALMHALFAGAALWAVWRHCRRPA